MGYTSLLVHTVNNNIDNIEILLAEKYLGTDVDNIISEIIKEQMNKILENAELYYLEEDCYAKNKDVVFLIEYVKYLFDSILEEYQESENTCFVFSTIYKNKKVKIENELLKIQQLLNYLLISVTKEATEIQLNQIEDELHIRLNLEKKQEHGLQIK